MAQPQVQLGWDNTSLEAGARRGASTVDAFERRTQGAFSKLGKLNLGGLFAGIGVGVIASSIRSVADEFGRLTDLADQLNEAPESLQRLDYIAKANGSNVEELTKGWQKFNRALQDTGNTTAQEALRELNIDAARFIRLAPEQQLYEFAAAFQAAETRGQGLNAVFDLLGKAGGNLLPILRSNVDALKELASSPVLSEDQLRALDDFSDAWTRTIDVQKAQLARFALDSVTFAKAFSAAWRESANVFSRAFGDAFRKNIESTQRLATANNQAREAARQFTREMAAQREEADRADATFKGFTKTLAEQVEQQERLGNRIGALRGQLDGIKLDLGQSSEQQLDDALRRLELINAQIEEIQSEEPSQGGDEEVLQLQIEQKRLLQEILALRKRIGEEADREAEKQKEATDKTNKERDAKLQGIRDLEGQLEILRLEASGQEKAAAALARKLKIQEEAKRIAKETGLSDEESLRIAKEKADLEDKIAKRRERGSGGRRRIQGYSQSQRTPRESEIDKHFRPQDRDFFERNQRTPGLDEGFGRVTAPGAASTTGVTRRAASIERVASAPDRPRDLQTDVLRILSSIDKTLADSLS